jgi:type II secretory pathway component PulC
MANAPRENRIRLIAGSRHWLKIMMMSIYRIAKWVRIALICVVVSVASWMWLAWSRLPVPAPVAPPVAAVPTSTVAEVVFNEELWQVWAQRDGDAGFSIQSLTERFRLAGTFLAYPGDQAEAGADTHRAILDDVEYGGQRLVRQGDRLGEVEVRVIERDRVVLRGRSGEEELRLTYAGSAEEGQRAPPGTASTGTVTAVPLRFEDMPSLEENRFGRRIADNRWILSREELLRYADEIKQDPLRSTQLFAAMRADYTESNDIVGYELDLLGENELYESVGLQNGDIVRAVNSLPMTHPQRAGYFINEFMEGRISAIVLDIERDGERQQLIHLIR